MSREKILDFDISSFRDDKKRVCNILTQSPETQGILQRSLLGRERNPVSNAITKNQTAPEEAVTFGKLHASGHQDRGRSWMIKQRKDSERRVRQCERFARLIRITRLLLGHGLWGPDDLAKEIDCSPRTIYRDIQTLSMAGIPIHFDKGCQAYRVPDGFRFPGVNTSSGVEGSTNSETAILISDAKKMLSEGERFLGSLRQLISGLEARTKPAAT
jgi:biotin operon repressor